MTQAPEGWTWRELDPDGNVVQYGTDPIELQAVALGDVEEE